MTHSDGWNIKKNEQIPKSYQLLWRQEELSLLFVPRVDAFHVLLVVRYPDPRTGCTVCSTRHPTIMYSPAQSIEKGDFPYFEFYKPIILL